MLRFAPLMGFFFFFYPSCCLFSSSSFPSIIFRDFPALIFPRQHKYPIVVQKRLKWRFFGFQGDLCGVLDGLVIRLSYFVFFLFFFFLGSDTLVGVIFKIVILLLFFMFFLIFSCSSISKSYKLSYLNYSISNHSNSNQRSGWEF